MASRMKRVGQAVVFAGWIVLAVAACDGRSPLAPARESFPTAASLDDDVGDGSQACPPGISLVDCEFLTQQERQELWWDIQNGVKWFNSTCAAIGARAQDFVLYGDIRKYDGTQIRISNPNFAVGYWQLHFYMTGLPQISYDRVYTQGWTSERTRIIMHEATHDYRQMGDLADSWDPLGPGTYWIENNCYNY